MIFHVGDFCSKVTSVFDGTASPSACTVRFGVSLQQWFQEVSTYFLLSSLYALTNKTTTTGSKRH